MESLEIGGIIGAVIVITEFSKFAIAKISTKNGNNGVGAESAENAAKGAYRVASENKKSLNKITECMTRISITQDNQTKILDRIEERTSHLPRNN